MDMDCTARIEGTAIVRRVKSPSAGPGGKCDPPRRELTGEGFEGLRLYFSRITKVDCANHRRVANRENPSEKSRKAIPNGILRAPPSKRTSANP